MRDYLVDGENALIAGAHVPDRFAALLGRVLTEDGLRERLGASARRTIEERFTEDAIGRSYATLFTRLITRDVTS
jgi:glycosyltransferase involved in cell wall biosynthesis